MSGDLYSAQLNLRKSVGEPHSKRERERLIYFYITLLFLSSFGRWWGSQTPPGVLVWRCRCWDSSSPGRMKEGSSGRGWGRKREGDRKTEV